MKRLLFLSLFALILASCKKEKNTNQNQTNNTNTPTNTCCSVQHVPQNNIPVSPDSVKSNGSWQQYYKQYVIITDNIITDTVFCNGSWGKGGVEYCNDYYYYGSTYGANQSNNYFLACKFEVRLPNDSVSLKNMSKGKYGIFNGVQNKSCFGHVGLTYINNNIKHEAIPQSDCSTFFNRIDEIKFLYKELGYSYYSIKGIAKIKVINTQDNTTTKNVDLIYRLIAEYDK